MLHAFLDSLPLIAILRGITPEEILPVGRVLSEAGFRVIEVPLNSPRACESIRRLRDDLDEQHLVGAGTVLSEQQVREVAAAGGQIVVMPHSDPVVIRAVKSAGLYCAPGVMTPTEGFAALAAGADALKLFPGEMIGPAGLKAMRAVFPRETVFIPVGGITPDTLEQFVAAGASGFGLGTGLYRPGVAAADVARNARAFTDAWERIRAR
ncbi:MAG: 2-dehydro-3-deoxy-6-phosphogalactonate aldolase [Gemmatimonadetes bacterium]|nr:2-dehydro-3-deoxy-6-phosphogalactonate aldolase [Gemmatimonadota bacterium]